MSVGGCQVSPPTPFSPSLPPSSHSACQLHILFYESYSSLFVIYGMRQYSVLKEVTTPSNKGFSTHVEFEFHARCLSCLIAHREFAGFKVCWSYTFLSISPTSPLLFLSFHSLERDCALSPQSAGNRSTLYWLSRFGWSPEVCTFWEKNGQKTINIVQCHD